MKVQGHHYLWLKWFSGFALLLAAIWIGQALQRFDLSWLENLKQNVLASVALILFLFALKAMTVILIPSTFLYLLSGLLFPAGFALAIVLAGTTGEFVLNYYMGRTFGRRQVRRLTAYLVNRHDRLHRLAEKQMYCDPLMIFLLRFLPGPPNTVTSLLLGSSKLSLIPFLWPSILGAVPKASAITLAGTSMLNPLSWQFLLPTALFGLLVILAILWHRHHQSVEERLAPDEASDAK